MLWLLSGPSGFTCLISFAPVLSFINFICGSFVDQLCYICFVLLCFHARLFVDAMWSPAGKGLTSWLSFVMSYCYIVTFPLVSWVRCGYLRNLPYLTEVQWDTSNLPVV